MSLLEKGYLKEIMSKSTEEKIRLKCPLGHIYVTSYKRVRQRGEKWACTTCARGKQAIKDREHKEMVDERKQRDLAREYYNEPE